jgi:hypothetical protein
MNTVKISRRVLRSVVFGAVIGIAATSYYAMSSVNFFIAAEESPIDQAREEVRLAVERCDNATAQADTLPESEVSEACSEVSSAMSKLDELITSSMDRLLSEGADVGGL